VEQGKGFSLQSCSKFGSRLAREEAGRPKGVNMPLAA